MKTVSMRRVRILEKVVAWGGFIGICSSLQANSTGWALVALICWGVAEVCINHTWEFGTSGELIVYNGSVLGRLKEDCCILNSSLPKGFTLSPVKKGIVATVATELFVRAAWGEGYVVRFSVIIKAAVGTSVGAIDAYYQHFIQSNCSERAYVVQVLKDFQQQEEVVSGLMGSAYRYEAGKSGWALSFQRSLKEFLEEAFTAVGLQTTLAEVTYMGHARSILIEGGKQL